MTITQTAARLVAAAGILLALPNAQAIDAYYNNAEGAIKGYDPVAYFVANQPVKGERGISTVWEHTTWYFASEANKQAFIANPEKFAPQFGGYCAYGVSQGYAPQTDPTAYTVVDGKLYLNYNHTVSDKWNADRDGFIALARQNWPALKAGDKVDK